MDHFKKLQQHVSTRLILVVLFINGTVAASMVALLSLGLEEPWLAGIAAFGLACILTGILMPLCAKYALTPLRHIWEAVVHINSAPGSRDAPNLDKLRVGRELVTTLVTQLYQLASQQDNTSLIEHSKQLSQAANVVNHLPLPLFVCNKQQLVTNVSNQAINYCGLDSAELLGKPLFELLNLEFHTDKTLEAWIQDCESNKIIDIAYWERVRVRLPGEEGLYKQCDISASYNRDNVSGTEFIITLFDRTTQYNQDDDSLSFIALAVHELRTPLTMLRGYVEVFEEELKNSLTPEMQSFMFKMRVSADQLSAFVNNILNVARVEENQLILQLSEADWKQTVQGAAEMMQLKAQVNEKTILYEIADDIPSVGIDQLSITEVINNLLDNAIKYSGTPTPEDPKPIIVKSFMKDGLVNTTITDKGIGMPSSVTQNLFEKFYRNHRTKGKVGGTGLGLYLSKAIITAHGGQIWVESKEGEGTTFGFTVMPFSQLAEEKKNSNNDGIVRNAHGWIKNHSLYRR